MASFRHSGISYRRAYALSIALHVLCAALLVVTATPFVIGGTSSGVATAGETTRVARFTIERRSRASAVRAAQPRHVTRMTRVANVAARAVPRPAAARLREPQPATSRAAGASRTRSGALALTIVTPPPERSAAAIVPQAARTILRPAAVQAAPSPSAAPHFVAAAPSASEPPQTSIRGADVPSGGWGQTFVKPLVADDDALASVRADYHASVVATVDVDESGRATRVTLPASFAGDAKSEIEKRLLALRYVPAECNGLRCTGTLQVTI